MTYEIDVTPANDPLGTILTTLGDDDLLAGTRFRPVKLGTGMVQVVIDADSAKAGALEDEVYLRIRDTVIGSYIYSGSLSNAQIKLVSERKDRRVLTWSGLGALGPLSRMSLGEDIYALGPPVQVARGSYDMPGMWTWTNQPYGAIGRRMFEEGRDHPDNPFAGMTVTFDRDGQTGGAPWTLFPTLHQEQVGTNVLDAYVNLVKAGVIFELTPGLVLNGYETFGSDHSGPAFAADVVRFMVGASALDSAANILTDAERAWSSMRVSELIVVGADNVTVKVNDPTAPFGKVGVYHYPQSSDPAVLTAVGNAELQRRLLRTIGALKLPVILENDPLNGKYLPGPGRPLWPANTVSAFTGGAAYDFDAAFPTAALDFLLTDAYGWTCEAELGTPFIDRAQAAQDFAICQIIKSSTPGPHGHPEILCPPGIACADLPDALLTAGTATNGDVEDGGTPWSGGAVSTAHFFDGTHSYVIASSTDGTIAYTFNPAQEFDTERQVAKIYVKAGETVGQVDLRFGVDGGDEEIMVDATPGPEVIGADGGNWAPYTMCWRPTQTRTGVRVSVRLTQAVAGYIAVDALSLYTTTNDELDGTSSHALRCDKRFRAQDIDYNDVVTQLGGGNVQTAIEALRVLIGSGSFVEKINGGNETARVVADCGAAHTIDLSLGNHQDLTLTEACTFTMPAPGRGKSFTAFFRGAFTPTLTGVVWPGGVAPDWSGLTDIVGFISDATTWYGVFGGSTAAALIVREVAGSDIDPVAELEFDADDFTVTDQGGGVARVALAGIAGTLYEPLAVDDGAGGFDPVYTADGRFIMVPVGD